MALKAPMIVHLNGNFLPKEQARISPDDRGFLFGDGVYETVRAFDGHLFRAAAHWQRLRNSLAALGMEGPGEAEVQKIAENLLEQNRLRSGEATVYVQVTRGVAARRHSYPQPSVPPTVYAFAASFAIPRDKYDSGTRVITVPDLRWARCDIKSVSLLANLMANEAARAAGAHEAILVREGVVTEGSHANFAAVRDGTLITHPVNHFILNGITRVVVLELCRELNIPVCEVAVAESELARLDEAMLLGTTNDVMPVVRINEWTIGSGKPGPVTRRLQQAFYELVAREKSGAPSAT
jgi:D-alanine transaminase